MLLTERYFIKKSNSLFNELDKMSFLSKNLYNQALYRIRQFYFQNKKYLRYEVLNKQFTITLINITIKKSYLSYLGRVFFLFSTTKP